MQSVCVDRVWSYLGKQGVMGPQLALPQMLAHYTRLWSRATPGRCRKHPHHTQ